MKEFKQTTSFEETVEKIEGIIEAMEPNDVIHLHDIIGKTADRSVTEATVMLLKKYGITYLEDE